MYLLFGGKTGFEEKKRLQLHHSIKRKTKEQEKDWFFFSCPHTVEITKHPVPKRLNIFTCVKQRKTWVLESCCCDVKSNVRKKERGRKRKRCVCTLKRKLPTKIKILSFVYFDEIGFEEQIVKYLPNLVHIPVFLSFFLPLLYCFFFPPYKSHLNVSGWNHILSAQPVASGCLCLFVCSGWPWFTRDCSSLRVRDSHFGYVHIHSRSMASSKQRYFRRSNTQTEPSDALAPTLSPAAFQQTSKMPPVPL